MNVGSYSLKPGLGRALASANMSSRVKAPLQISIHIYLGFHRFRQFYASFTLTRAGHAGYPFTLANMKSPDLYSFTFLPIFQEKRRKSDKFTKLCTADPFVCER